MIVTPVDGSFRLFHIREILCSTALKRLTSLDWSSIVWERPPQQESWKRRSLTDKHSVLADVNMQLRDLSGEIGERCGVEFSYPSTAWWLDEPGFTVDLHTDGHLPAAMQLCWLAPDAHYGTAFYTDPRTLRHQFESVPNTGYIMLNQPNIDGSQPLQWHSMTNSVPSNTLRITSYTTFGAYNNK